MKVRTGFVSNSSSSSFVLILDKKPTKSYLKKIFDEGPKIIRCLNFIIESRSLEIVDNKECYKKFLGLLLSNNISLEKLLDKFYPDFSEEELYELTDTFIMNHLGKHLVVFEIGDDYSAESAYIESGKPFRESNIQFYLESHH